MYLLITDKQVIEHDYDTLSYNVKVWLQFEGIPRGYEDLTTSEIYGTTDDSIVKIKWGSWINVSKVTYDSLKTGQRWEMALSAEQMDNFNK